MKNGVPWDLAMGRSPVLRRAASIILQEFEGRKFDVERFRWEDS